MASQEYHEKNLERSLHANSMKLQDLSSTAFEFGRWYGKNEAFEGLIKIMMPLMGQQVSVVDVIATIHQEYGENTK